MKTKLGMAAAVVVALASNGCAPSVRAAGASAAEGAVPAGTHSALSTLEDPATRARIAAIVASPEVQRAINDLSAGVSRGVVDGLTSEEVKRRLDELVSSLANAVVRAVDSAFDEALSDRNQKAVDRFASAITTSVMRSAAGEIPESIAPAIRKAMVEELGPGLAEAIRSPEMKAALGELSHDVARSATLGANNALAELDEKRKEKEGGMPLGGVGAFFAGRTWLLAALVVGLILAIPLAWLLRERRRSRRMQEQAMLRTERAAALLSALEASRDKGAVSPDMITFVRKQLLGEPAEVLKEEEEEGTQGGPPRPQPA